MKSGGVQVKSSFKACPKSSIIRQFETLPEITSYSYGRAGSPSPNPSFIIVILNVEGLLGFSNFQNKRQSYTFGWRIQGMIFSFLKKCSIQMYTCTDVYYFILPKALWILLSLLTIEETEAESNWVFGPRPPRTSVTEEELKPAFRLCSLLPSEAFHWQLRGLPLQDWTTSWDPFGGVFWNVQVGGRESANHIISLLRPHHH